MSVVAASGSSRGMNRSVFVGEYTCGGGMATVPDASLPESLLAEGSAMLRALCDDLASVATVHTMLDPRFEIRLGSAQLHPFDRSRDLQRQWSDLAKRCDKCIIIAPETSETLRTIVATLRSVGLDPIACSDSFLACGTDKLLFASHMKSGGVPHPRTFSLADFDFSRPTAGRWIVKPRDGCGSDNIYSCQSADEIRTVCAGASGDWIVQAHHSGIAASIAMIVGDGGRIDWLPAASQRIDPRSFAYRGGTAPLPLALQNRAQRIAASALGAMPGEPRGYVGFDLILGADPPSDVVVEVNPRLTTSFVGLRHLMKSNLAARICELDRLPLIRWHDSHPVDWMPDGTMRTHE